jgi:hypothetical protein
MTRTLDIVYQRDEQFKRMLEVEKNVKDTTSNLQDSFNRLLDKVMQEYVENRRLLETEKIINERFGVCDQKIDEHSRKLYDEEKILEEFDVSNISL